MRSAGSLRRILLAVLLVGALSACRAAELEFDGQRAYQHVLRQCEFGPRYVGSEAGQRTAEYIAQELSRLGWTTEMQEFAYQGVAGRNVVGAKGRGPLILLGAHYDTRSVADRDPFDPGQPVLGANDGASGVAVLLELARVLDIKSIEAEVWLVFFDAEDQGGIGGWPFSVGAAFMAEHLVERPEAVVVVDMVGDAEQEILFERNSDLELSSVIWAIAEQLGYQQHFIPEYGHSIIDDHLPFIERGIDAVDIIDIDYPYWHTGQDTPDKVSPESLERVGRVLEVWMEGYLQPWTET
jgi:glutaminyl-peptide cyclotransferase